MAQYHNITSILLLQNTPSEPSTYILTVCGKHLQFELKLCNLNPQQACLHSAIFFCGDDCGQHNDKPHLYIFSRFHGHDSH